MRGNFLDSNSKAKRFCRRLIIKILSYRYSINNKYFNAGYNLSVLPGVSFIMGYPLTGLYRLLSLILILTFTIFITSCGTSKKQKQNVNTTTYFYKQETLTEQVIKEKVIYKQDSTLDLYINLFLAKIPGTEDIENGSQSNKTHEYTLRYLLLNNQKTNNILDSGVVTFKAESENKSYYQYQFKNLNVKKEQEFIIRIELYDFTRHIRFIRTRWINLNLPQGDLKFLLHHLPDSQPYLHNYFTRKDSFLINYSGKEKEKLFLLYSSVSHKAAAPPFFTSNNKDKTQIFRTDSISTFTNGNKIRFYHTGNYIIKPDTLRKEGFWLNCFMNGFPELAAPQNFADPLIYITSKNEYLNLQNAGDKKLEAYNFWYSALGNTRRGGMAADAYYKRVSQANALFTSFKEGWKTDRGMIYIVFGKPDVIYKDKNGENWVYDESNFFPGAKFIFTRIPEPWGDEFILVRNENLSNIWYIAVDSWRRGRLKF